MAHEGYEIRGGSREGSELRGKVGFSLYIPI